MNGCGERVWLMYRCTMTGLFLGICDHLLITLIPIPLADAGYETGTKIGTQIIDYIYNIFTNRFANVHVQYMYLH